MKAFSSPSVKTVVGGMIVVGLIVLAFGGYLSPLSRVAFKPFVSIQTWIATRVQAIQNLTRSPSDMNQLRLENARLDAEVARLEAQIIQLQQQIRETRTLSTLLGFVRAHPENTYVTAAVIGYDPSPFLHYVLINRGSDDGLRRGMPVVTSQGLVGRVAAVAPNAARVQLITDPGSHVNVRLQKAAVDAAVSGSLTADLLLEAIPQNVQVEDGDVILTSGLGGDYPADLEVGQVVGVKKLANDLFQTASVQPAADFGDLKIVLVITNFRPIKLDVLIPTPVAP